jgi:hypothetical protein
MDQERTSIFDEQPEAVSSRLIVSALRDKFGFFVEYSDIDEHMMVGQLDSAIFFSATWQGTVLRLYVEDEIAENKLLSAFQRKRLCTSRETDRSLCVIVCDVDKFIDWSKKATEWKDKRHTARNRY